MSAAAMTPLGPEDAWQRESYTLDRSPAAGRLLRATLPGS